MRTEEYVVWERRFRGLCRTTEYYVGRPARRSVPHVHNQVTYSLQPEAIKVTPLPCTPPSVCYSLRRLASLARQRGRLHPSLDCSIAAELWPSITVVEQAVIESTPLE